MIAKGYCCVFFIISFVANIRRAEAETTYSLTLTKAQQLAISKNLTLAQKKSAVAEKVASQKGTYARFYPQIGIAGGINGEQTSTESSSGLFSYAYANYNLFNGFADRDKADISGIELAKAELELEQAQASINLEIEDCFNNILFADAVLQLHHKAQVVNQELAKVVERRRYAGAGSGADVLEFEMRDTLLKSETTTIEQERGEQLLKLAALVGVPKNDVITVVGQLQHHHIRGDLNYYLTKLQERSPEIRKTQMDMAIADKETLLWRSEWLPKIDAEARYGRIPLDYTENETRVKAEYLLIARMELFSGFESVYARQKSQELRNQQQQNQLSKNSSTETALRNHYTRINAIQKNVDFEHENVERTKKYYDIVLREYNAGIKNSVDLKTAAEMMFQAPLRLLKYTLDFHLEKTQMSRLLGVAVETDEIQ